MSDIYVYRKSFEFCTLPFVFRKIVDILTSDTLEVFELKEAEVVILIFKFS